jgi:hypothetical protein
VSSESSWEHEAETRVAKLCNEAGSDYEQEINGSAEELDGTDGEQQQPGDTCRVRKARTSTKWPVDKMVVIEIDEVGLPTERRHILRLWKLAGLIARETLSLAMPKFNSLTKADKWRLFD